MIQAVLRTFLILSFASCSHGDIKVYKLKPGVGLIHKEEGTTKFEDIKENHYCAKVTDLITILHLKKSCE